MFGIQQQKILDLFAAWGRLCVECVSRSWAAIAGMVS